MVAVSVLFLLLSEPIVMLVFTFASASPVLKNLPVISIIFCELSSISFTHVPKSGNAKLDELALSYLFLFIDTFTVIFSMLLVGITLFENASL